MKNGPAIGSMGLFWSFSHSSKQLKDGTAELMMEDLAEITEIIRECDDKFQDTGGSTRHYVRNVLLPLLEERGWLLIKIGRLKKIDADVLEIKRELVKKLSDKGYSIRQIQRALEYKSPRSVHKILKESKTI